MRFPVTLKLIAVFLLGLATLATTAVLTYPSVTALLEDDISGPRSGMERAERAGLKQPDAAVRSSARDAAYAAMAGFFTGLAVIVLSFLFIRREVIRFHRTEELLRKLTQAVEQSGELVAITTRRGKILYINGAVEETTGYARKDLGRRRGTARLPWHGDKEALKKMRDTVLAGSSFRATAACRKKNGEIFHLDEAVSPVSDRKGKVTHLVYTARDITREKQLQGELDYRDAYDPLTKLPNRAFFAEWLGRVIARAKQEDRFLSVLALDIDRFKYVNDVLGPEAGDEVLKWVAERLRASIGKEDIAARLGNDEFGVVHLDESQPVDVAAIVSTIQQNVLQNDRLLNDGMAVTITAGVAVYPQDGEDAQTLIQNADLALSKAKSQGRNNVQFYTADIPARISEFVHLEKRLFSALKNDEYMVYYQPYCDLTTARMAGAEALVKWKDKDLGVVSPQKFIPSIEDTGMIIDVGEWVLKTACRQIREWGKGKLRFPVSVNLSMIQFRHKYLLNMVSDTIKEYKLDPRRLTLEITESIFMHDMDFASGVLKRLKNIGVSISVDDFGTGYSSLSYLTSR
jgi:diguanylate cyclase (GGDEF)-like protein/PAS domain S-box-containing protein